MHRALFQSLNLFINLLIWSSTDLYMFAIQQAFTSIHERPIFYFILSSKVLKV